MSLHLSSSPHIRKNITTRDIMLDVILALLPATIVGAVLFGLKAVLIIAVCIATCVLAEFLFNLILKKEQTVGDLSAVVTGLLLALNLPSTTPLWQAVIGSAFAIIVVKCIFGGLGCNVVNPAMTARVFMLLAFPATVAKYAFPTFVKTVDATSGATPLSLVGTENALEIKDLALGFTGGAIGETCAIALLLGGIYLIVCRVITWHIPVSFIGTVFVLSFLLDGFSFYNAFSWILSGGLFISAFFMATDYVTSPHNPIPKIIFGAGAGVITTLIRFYGNVPEGVSYGILLMNILNPYIEKIAPRKLFGGKKG